ncbi:hypothetical protein BE61_45670 [Bradyrhizobium elkanii USDA 61]|nr:hypothetical protein BE61_45670 [Bradyrhizobium elkanii USDA 61]GEC52675.1 hypothetical protein BEL01nite_17180 [Bradyrhizobium elkanii]
MMIGTPGRTGTTMSKPPPASAVEVIAANIASARLARMFTQRPELFHHNLIQRLGGRVKDAGQTAGKPNA